MIIGVDHELFCDESIWEALDAVGVAESVRRSEKGLETEASVLKSNSEKLLLLLARAILRKTKVILREENSAEGDFETEEFIKEITRLYLKETTVITVAHRLNTVIEAD